MSDRPEKLKKDFTWTKKAQKLLDELIDPLRRTLDAWETFRSVNGRNGDIGYFSDLDSTAGVALPFPDIQDTFEDLESHYKKLVRLKSLCDTLAEEVRRPSP